MSKLNDLSNKIFGNWKVLYRNGNKNGFAVWHCKCCLCGKEYDVVGKSLIDGVSTKCRSCSTSQIKTKPFSKDPIKYIFSGMWQRCYDKNHIHFLDYGGRGITVCDEWLKDRIKFYKWAYENGYRKGLSIERIDNNKGYSPDNCCFIPKSKQSGNRKNSIMVTINDKTQCLSWWCKEFNISREKVKWLVKRDGIAYKEAIQIILRNDKNKNHTEIVKNY